MKHDIIRWIFILFQSHLWMLIVNYIVMRNIIKRLDRAIINSKLIVPVPAQSLVLWSTNDYKAPSYRFQHQYSHGHVGMLSRRDLNQFWHVVQYWPFHKFTNLIQCFKKEQTTMNVNVGDLIFAWASMFGPTPQGLLFEDSIKSNVIRKHLTMDRSVYCILLPLKS